MQGSGHGRNGTLPAPSAGSTPAAARAILPPDACWRRAAPAAATGDPPPGVTPPGQTSGGRAPAGDPTTHWSSRARGGQPRGARSSTPCDNRRELPVGCGKPFRGVLNYFRMYLSSWRDFLSFLRTGRPNRVGLADRGLRPAGGALFRARAGGLVSHLLARQVYTYPSLSRLLAFDLALRLRACT